MNLRELAEEIDTQAFICKNKNYTSLIYTDMDKNWKEGYLLEGAENESDIPNLCKWFILVYAMKIKKITKEDYAKYFSDIFCESDIFLRTPKTKLTDLTYQIMESIDLKIASCPGEKEILFSVTSRFDEINAQLKCKVPYESWEDSAKEDVDDFIAQNYLLMEIEPEKKLILINELRLSIRAMEQNWANKYLLKV